MPDFDRLVADLALARMAEQQYKDDVAMLERKLAETPEGRALARIKGELLPQALGYVALADEAVRQAALSHYAATGERRPHEGVQIVMVTRLSYAPEAAVTYCAEHYLGGLKLDRRAFERVAQAVKPPFVEVAQEPSVRIASELPARDLPAPSCWQEET